MKLFVALLLTLALLSGCVPATQTAYVEQAAAEPSFSVACDAITAPEQALPHGYQALAFLFFGDAHPPPETLDFSGVGALIAYAASREMPELAIFGGDTVDDGGDEGQWGDFWQAVGPSLDGLATAAVAGNHDRHDLLADQFDYPYEAPQGPGEGFFYTFRLGPVFFIMLDSNIMGAANQRDIQWLRSELESDAALQAGWRVAVMHHPMWPVADIPRDMQRAETMRIHFLPILEAYNVDLILCGHQHVYTRTYPMRGGAAAADGRGIVQIMAASGDKPSYAAGERDFIAASFIAPNYLMLVADVERLSITAFNGEHEVIDKLTIQR